VSDSARSNSPRSCDLYRTTFDPRAYLRTYYETRRVTEDEVANLTALLGLLRSEGRSFRTVLEVGCGPTIHHAIPLMPHAGEIHLSDYVEGNLAEVRKWLGNAPGAHDWGVYLRWVLAMEGIEPTPEAVRRLADELRSRVTALKACDLHQDDPLRDGATYDLVTCFYTAECAARSRREWERVMRRLASLVRPGGVLFQAAMRDCDHYAVGDRAIPSVPINEADFADVLPRWGFDPEQTRIEPVAVSEWAGHGFQGICVVRAVKRADGLGVGEQPTGSDVTAGPSSETGRLEAKAKKSVSQLNLHAE
jgi:SAM-dependent methyltransferase